jgi:hypothetical protein
LLQQVETTPEKVLIVNQKTLQAAGLFGRVRLLIGRGEIRIVSDTAPKPETFLDRPHTWELCGSLAIAEPEAVYVISHDESGRAITNYAEHVDDVLYRGR